mgnify:CR=1 FL=1
MYCTDPNIGRRRMYQATRYERKRRDVVFYIIASDVTAQKVVQRVEVGVDLRRADRVAAREVVRFNGGIGKSSGCGDNRVNSVYPKAP